ncbi:Solute carrier family 45 member 4 [Anas platyrhynchos]|uniref:Solute carrier family 45 member 4 n=1 Tax=Anas platyrhynchos TaxID=8839 RepID=R0LCL7_ANAPL|nr:Solute carrier family 45 member 4 [Anas platyrhynchos]
MQVQDLPVAQLQKAETKENESREETISEGSIDRIPIRLWVMHGAVMFGREFCYAMETALVTPVLLQIAPVITRTLGFGGRERKKRALISRKAGKWGCSGNVECSIDEKWRSDKPHNDGLPLQPRKHLILCFVPRAATEGAARIAWGPYEDHTDMIPAEIRREPPGQLILPSHLASLRIPRSNPKPFGAKERADFLQLGDASCSGKVCSECRAHVLLPIRCT